MRFPFSRPVVILALWATSAFAEDKTPATPADFRVAVKLRDVSVDQTLGAELLAYKGRMLEIIDGRHELLLIDPAARRIEMLNLNLKCIARISFDRLDAETLAYKARIHRTVDKLSASDERAARLDAKKTSDLLSPQGAFTYHAPTHTLRRAGPTTDVTATGEPDDDKARLELIRLSLVYLLKLDTYRSPGKIPPFAQLQAVEALIQDHRLRPTEMSFLYRLNGPPIRFRWTYAMAPALTSKDVELWTKLDNFLKTAEVLDLDAYEKAVQPKPVRPSTRAGR